MDHSQDHSDQPALDEALPAEDALPERRREARLPIATKATLFPPLRHDLVPGEPMQPAVGTRRIALQDISFLGCRFRAAGPHEPGERWRIKVEAGPMKLDGQVEVVRCDFNRATGYEIGARFLTTQLPLRTAAPATSVPRNPSHHLVPRKAS